ncbi:sugar transferase [Microbacterium saccharophilum]|uniref:Sugar transferase n=1 Tax=Microbacterium saccharophilum TaxID=1213358 RepID=A0A5C8IAP7_9MICO|nr:sugar transferase [Microbacterium saccharophilum]TXK15412.1 sugar transferase [Microbacterium saccharophilum]
MTSKIQADATQTSPESDEPETLRTSAGAVPTTTGPIDVRKPDRWRDRYARRLWLTDLVALVWVVYGTQIAWFGLGNVEVSIREDTRISDVSYWVFSAILIAAWMAALSLADTRDYRVIGTGPTEYTSIVRASFFLFGAVAIIAFLSRVDVARGFLVISLPFGIIVLILERWLWRQWLVAKRLAGQYSARVLLVGSRESVAQVARELARSSTSGYRVVGACVPSGKVADMIDGTDIPIMGNVDSISRAIAVTNADTVAVTSTDELPPFKVKQISWGLEAGQQHLVLAPSIVDVAGPRIHIRPVAGLPLIHVETPKFTRGQAFAKRMTDLMLSIAGGVLISPVLLALALLVKFSSPGPVLFRQTRIGYQGRQFTMLKFRSMVTNAEDLLPGLQQQRDAGNEVLFKMKNDPRVTPVGRVMRRFSLDELPQIFNVISGSMSLVGPRPPLPNEVAVYADHVHRRFLAKPGITGAWQVGGRSTLSWDESVRLDLSYVENWSLLGDFVILARTLRATIAPSGSAH